MTTVYEVFTPVDRDMPTCDRCQHEDLALETVEGPGTCIAHDRDYPRMERVCRYCYETELGGYTRLSGPTITQKTLTRGIVHCFNTLEKVLRMEVQAGIVGLARAMADETTAAAHFDPATASVYTGPENRNPKRPTRRLRQLIRARAFDNRDNNGRREKD